VPHTAALQPEWPPGANLIGTRGDIAFGFCMTGSDGVDAYLAQRQFERQSPVQRFDGEAKRFAARSQAVAVNPAASFIYSGL
jgi:hypothetical protein